MQEKITSNIIESVAKRQERVVIHILAKMTQGGERP